MYLILFLTSVFVADLRWSSLAILISKNDLDKHNSCFIYLCYSFSRVLFFMQSRIAAQLKGLFEFLNERFLQPEDDSFHFWCKELLHLPKI